MQQDYVQPRQVARELGVLPQNIYAWLWSGILPAHQDPESRCWLISRVDLEAFKEKRRTKNHRKDKITKH